MIYADGHEMAVSDTKKQWWNETVNNAVKVKQKFWNCGKMEALSKNI